MAKVYCKYCGLSENSVYNLTHGKCEKHPNGVFKGYHALYEGSEKSQYTCKYCGQSERSLYNLTHGKCSHHPDGVFKGYHSPAL